MNSDSILRQPRKALRHRERSEMYSQALHRQYPIGGSVQDKGPDRPEARAGETFRSDPGAPQPEAYCRGHRLRRSPARQPLGFEGPQMSLARTHFPSTMREGLGQTPTRKGCPATEEDTDNAESLRI